MGNWTVVVHGVGSHGYPDREDTRAASIEAKVLEFVERLKAEGQHVNFAVVTSGVTCASETKDRSHFTTLEQFAAPPEPYNPPTVEQTGPLGIGGKPEAEAPLEEGFA